jgi:cell division initiation protein
MMTPQEAEARVFTKANFGGYNIQQVDTFLDTLIEDYGALYQENATLKSKMKLLVDKVEEYRSTEDAMRKALHSAQKMADELIQEGEAKKAAAIEAAVTEAREQSEAVRAQLVLQEEAEQAKLDALRTDLANEEVRLEAARAATTAYVAKLKELYTQELTYIGSLSSLTAADVQARKEAEAQPAPQPEAAPEPDPQATQTFQPVSEPAKEAEGQDLSETRVFDQIQFDEDEAE